MKKYRLIIIIIILFCFAFGVAASLYHDVFREPRPQGMEGPRYFQHWSHPLAAHDLEFLGDWMTFTYINKVFGMPDAYLQTSLGIRTLGYPDITVRKAARDRGEDSQVFLRKIKIEITNYFAKPAL